MVMRYPQSEESMDRSYRSIEVEQVGDVSFVEFRNSSLEDSWIQQFGDDVRHLIEADGCRKLVLSFSNTDFLYSTMLSKLMTIRRLMIERGGRLRLCNVSPLVREVFRACKLEDYFEFAEDRETALRDW